MKKIDSGGALMGIAFFRCERMRLSFQNFCYFCAVKRKAARGQCADLKEMAKKFVRRSGYRNEKTPIFAASKLKTNAI